MAVGQVVPAGAVVVAAGAAVAMARGGFLCLTHQPARGVEA